MSGHSFLGSGDGPSRDQKPDHSKVVSSQTTATHVLPQAISHGEVLKSSLQAQVKAAIGNRSIAPAPGPTVVGQPVTQSSGAALSLTRLPAGVGITNAQVIGSHALVTKVPQGIIGNAVETPGSQGQGTGQQVSLSNTNVAVGTVQSAAALSLQQPPVQMASLIRGASLAPNTQIAAQLISQQQQQSAVVGQVAGSQQQTSQSTGQVTAHQLVHTYTPHVPRGAAAAVSALAQPKTGSVATAMLRAGQPGSQPVQLSSPTSTVATHVGSGGSVHGHVQPRALIPVRPSNPITPPATRPASPALTNVLHNQADTHRGILSSQPSTVTSTGTTVQITIQQPRSENTPRPTMLSQLQKQVVGSQPILQQTQLAQAQKVTLTQPGASPLLQAAPTTTTISTAKLIAQSQPYNLSQSIGRSQKIVMTHPASGSNTFTQGTTTVTSTAKSVMSNLTAKQKIIMTTQPVSTSALNMQTVSSQGALNLAPQQLRPQKVLMSQVGHGGNTATLHNITSLPKAGTISLAGGSGSITMTTTPATVSVPSIPVAKVPPQRQIPSQHQGHDTARENVTVVGGQQGQIGQQQTSIFLQQQQAHRASPVNPNTQSEARSQERVTNYSHQSYQTVAPNSSDFAYYQQAVYQNLMYPQLAAQAQAFTSLAGGTTIRPSSIVAAQQTSNLAATLQAAAHSVAVTTAQGVRLNPMMVTVDPRNPSLSVQAQYAGASDGPKPTYSSETGSSGFSSSAVTQQTVIHPGQQSPANPSASPRPSILRKRTSDGSIAAVKKNLLAAVSEVPGSATDLSSRSAFSPSRPSVPVDPSRENSQSSTDTATSTESTPQSATTPDLKLKHDDGLENGPNMTGILSSTPNIDESPRKRPRKQLLNATEDLRDADSTDDEVSQINTRAEIKKELEKINAIKENEEYIDDEGVRWVAQRQRPNISLLNHYQCTWKPRNNHFLRYQDVKPKDERRPTVNELSNQKGVLTKASGWKMYHLATQLEEMIDSEKDVLNRLSYVQDSIAPKHLSKSTVEDDVGMVHELTQGNIQRCQLVADQLDEAKSSMLKILDHKTRILEIINKHHSKRPVKKKERS